MQVQLKQIIFSPGQQLLMTDISWQMYEQMLEEFGEKRGARINYSQGVLEIMVPLPEHEVNKVIIGDLVKIILEERNLEFWSLGSTTFKSKAMKQGL
jgi:Uma2 family endonuclease